MNCPALNITNSSSLMSLLRTFKPHRLHPFVSRIFTMSHKTQEPVITKTSDLSLQEAKWITLKKIEYVDQVGKERTWEVATRKTRGKSGVDAVAMGNILLHPSKPASTLLVIQYRPPLDAYTIEWPAGLIDAEETAEEAAVREFKEETGYDCKVLSVSPAQAADPGMTNANMQLAMVEVQLSENEEEPEQRLDDGEHIQREIIPLAELYERLVEYSKRERTVVAAKLFHFAADGPQLHSPFIYTVSSGTTFSSCRCRQWCLDRLNTYPREQRKNATGCWIHTGKTSGPNGTRYVRDNMRNTPMPGGEPGEKIGEQFNIHQVAIASTCQRH
uniref:Nudix hydrolase domain-containing protein n=1 Tax=Gibberella zeae TaxID=5518 RepID=A0A4E9DTV1_GIBZA